MNCLPERSLPRSSSRLTRPTLRVCCERTRRTSPDPGIVAFSHLDPASRSPFAASAAASRAFSAT
eukprot:9505367-Prorocentrum_lima.AAC.1